MRKLLSMLFFLSFMSMKFSMAQTPVVTLTLQEAIKLGNEKGLQAQINSSNFLASMYQFKSQSVTRFPLFSINGNLPGFNRSVISVIQPDGSSQFRQQFQAYSSSSLNMFQQITSTGGYLYVNSGLNRLDLLGSNASTSWQSTPLIAGISQPLLRFNQYGFDWKIAQLKNQQNTRTYAENKEDYSISIVLKFYDVIIAKMELEQADYNILVNDTLLRVARGRYNLGKIGEDDLLQTELRLMNAQNAFDQSKLNFNTSENQLKILLGIDKTTRLQLTAIENIPLFEPDVDKAVYEAKKNRSDILSIKIDQEQTQAMLKKASLNRLPNAELSASYGLNQTATVVGDAYKSPLDQQRVTVGLNIPLMNWGKNRFDYRTAKYQMIAKQAQLDLLQLTLEQDVINEIGQYLQLRTRLEISAKADTIAQKRYVVAKNRYFIGKIDITNLNIAQTEKDQARSNYYATMRDFWLAYYRLRRLTLFDFEKNEQLFNKNQ